MHAETCQIGGAKTGLEIRMGLSICSFVFSCSGMGVFEGHPWDLKFSPN